MNLSSMWAVHQGVWKLCSPCEQSLRALRYGLVLSESSSTYMYWMILTPVKWDQFEFNFLKVDSVNKDEIEGMK